MAEKILNKLDKNTRVITGKRKKTYGGLNMIFIGDFKQMKPINGRPVYEKYSQLWHGSVNACIVLNNNHRFKDDPEWGDILKRISNGQATNDDIDKINSRVIGKNGLMLPKDG